MNNKNFTIFPAIHLRNGEVVRFTQGDIQNPIVFHTDPIACAQQWIDQGAEWLQVINLDAAFNEEASNNWSLIEKMCELDTNIQFGGGIRSIDDVHWAIKSGIKRVIIGTAAVKNPRLMADAITAYGSDSIVLSIDADEEGQVKIDGWQTGSSIQATSLAIQMRQLGVAQAIHTSIHRDGSMSGIDLQASIDLAALSGLNITVGGGIGDLDDVLECYNNDGINGVIIGKALYTGKVNLAEALKKAGQRKSFDQGLDRWKADQNTTWKRFTYQLVENNLKLHIPVNSPPLSILDAGGGNGLDSLALARMNHQVDLVDLSATMLNDAKANAALAGVSARVDTHAIDVLDIERKFTPESFDVVLCHNVIQYLDDIKALFKTMHKVLRKGGFLSLIGVNQYSLLYQAAYLDNDLDAAFRLLEHGQRHSSVFDIDMESYRADDIQQHLEADGFRISDQYGIGCLYDYWGMQKDDKNNPQTEKLKNLEMELMNRAPFKYTARYFHLIAYKS